MNWDTIKGQWQQFRGKVQEKWGKLTDNDVDVISGKMDQLVGKLHERYGYTREQAEREVNDFCQSCHKPDDVEADQRSVGTKAADAVKTATRKAGEGIKQAGEKIKSMGQ